MNSNHYTHKILKWVLPVVLLAITISGYFVLVSSKKRPAEAALQLKAPPLVDIMTVQLSTQVVPVTLGGTISPTQQTTLSSEVSGKILYTAEDMVAGGFFKKGELMFRIDDADYQVAVIQAKAALAQARLSEEREKELANQATEDWNSLGQGNPTDLALRKPHLAQAKADLAFAESALDKVLRDLSRTRIYAPYDCLVASRSVSIGASVSPGTPVAVILSVGSAEIRLPVTPTDASSLLLPEAGTSGIPATVSWEEGGKILQRPGTAVRTEGVMDPETRVQYLVVQVKDPYGIKRKYPPVMHGQFVDVTIPGKPVPDSAYLPAHCVSHDNKVKVIDAQNMIQFRDVHVVRRTGEKVLVTGGLKNGNRVVITPVDFAVEGSLVRTNDDSSTDFDHKPMGSFSSPHS